MLCLIAGLMLPQASQLVAQGMLTTDMLNTFGGYGVVEVPNLQELLQFICKNGFEHHVAANLSEYGEAVEDALSNYLGWEVYHHQ